MLSRPSKLYVYFQSYQLQSLDVNCKHRSVLLWYRLPLLNAHNPVHQVMLLSLRYTCLQLDQQKYLGLPSANLAMESQEELADLKLSKISL